MPLTSEVISRWWSDPILAECILAGFADDPQYQIDYNEQTNNQTLSSKLQTWMLSRRLDIVCYIYVDISRTVLLACQFLCTTP
jgi:hypothetical protein